MKSKSSKFLDDEYDGSDAEEDSSASSSPLSQTDQHRNHRHRNDDDGNDHSTATTTTKHNNSAPPGPGSAEDGLFHHLTSPFIGAAKAVSNTFRFLAGRMTEEEIKEKISKANELRDKVNRSLSRRIGNHVNSVNKKIFVGTWNVAKQSPPSTEEMKIWLNGNSTVKPSGKEDLPKIAVIGIQEATMSGTAMMLETTEAVAEWSEAFQSALHQLAKDAGHPIRYRKLDGVQLVGLVMLIFLPIDEFPYVRHLRTAVTRTGPLSTVGNKGAVGCRLTFHGKRFLFICGHFAPHEHNVQQRDHHYHSALDRLDLSMESESYDDLADFVLKLNSDESVNDRQKNEASIMSLFTNGIKGAGLKDRIFHRREFRKLKNATERSRALLHAHDYCFFFGDLNYRLVRSADHLVIKDLITSHKIKKLQQFDELNLGLKKGYIFEGFVEPPVHFLPTYKFAPLTDSYDISKRKPAWTDRVLVHCLNGGVDYGEQRMDTDRTRAYLITEEWKKKRQEEIFNLGRDVADECLNETMEEATTVTFMDVDDARDHYALLKRTNSNMSFGSNDDLASANSNQNTPPITPKMSATQSAGKKVVNALEKLSNKLSPSSFAGLGRKSNKNKDDNSTDESTFLLSTEQNYSNLAPNSSFSFAVGMSNNSSITSPSTNVTVVPAKQQQQQQQNTPPLHGQTPNNVTTATSGIAIGVHHQHHHQNGSSPSSANNSITPLQLSPSSHTITTSAQYIENSETSNNNNNNNNKSKIAGLFPTSLTQKEEEAAQDTYCATQSTSYATTRNNSTNNNEFVSASVSNTTSPGMSSLPPSVSPHQQNHQQNQDGLPKSTTSFEDFIRALDRCTNLNNTIENRVEVDWYCSIPSLRMSDHRPVAASFDCTVAFLSKEQEEILVFDTKQELGLDFLDEMKYAL